MTQVMNQFGQTPEKGQLDLGLNPNLVSCMVDATESGTLVPGQAVTVYDSAGGVPKVIAAAADTDDIFGFVPYDARKTSFEAGDYLEIAALRGNVMYMEASAAIARWAEVMVLISGSKVLTAAGATKRIVGRAFDKAAGSGSLIRVVIDLPGQTVAEASGGQAANVAALAGTLTGSVDGTINDVAAAAAATAGGATPSAAQVDTGIATAVAALVTSTNLALKELQTTLNAEIAALKAAGLQASV